MDVRFGDTVTHLVLPEQLAQQAAEAMRELLAEAAAANTTRSYATDLRYWAGWHQGRYGIELALEDRHYPCRARGHAGHLR